MPTSQWDHWFLSCRGKLMSDNLQKSRREVSVFQEFAERSGLPIGPNSIEKREPPEPDILCEVTGKGHVAFEIKEMCDEPIAKVVSALRKTKDDEPKFLRSGYAVQKIVIKTRNKKYRTRYPVELLFYTDGRIVLPVPSINSIRRRNPGILGVPATALAGCTEVRPVDDESR